MNGIRLIAAVIVAVFLAGAGLCSEPLDAEAREVLVKAVCGKIDKLYPFPEIGKRTRDGILEKLNSGAYDGIGSPKEFAARMTADMEALSNDRHLDLYHDPVKSSELTARAAEGDAQSGPIPSEVDHARFENFGFKELRMLDGGIGYLDLRMFFTPKHAGGVAVAAMEFLSNSNAVIIDLRRNGGGWDDMVTFLAGYFTDFGEPETVAVSRSNLDGTWFVSAVPAFVPGEKLAGISVYLLVSDATASAAEAFASILKHVNEEVVLVGRTTAGAENPVEFVVLDENFVLKIPCYEKIWFGTRPGWEAKGIRPDIEAPVEKALETAHLHALRSLLEKHAGKVAREKLQWGIDGHRAVLEPHTVDRKVLERYAGRYEHGRIFIEENDLYLQFGERQKKKMLPVADDYFVIEGRDDLRVRMVEEGGRIVAMERIYSDGWRGLDPRNH